MREKHSVFIAGLIAGVLIAGLIWGHATGRFVHAQADSKRSDFRGWEYCSMYTSSIDKSFAGIVRSEHIAVVEYYRSAGLQALIGPGEGSRTGGGALAHYTRAVKPHTLSGGDYPTCGPAASLQGQEGLASWLAGLVRPCSDVPELPAVRRRISGYGRNDEEFPHAQRYCLRRRAD